MKRKRKDRKAKAERTSLDKLIGAAETLDEKITALESGQRLDSDAKKIVFNLKRLHAIQKLVAEMGPRDTAKPDEPPDYPAQLKATRREQWKVVRESATRFILSALLGNHPEQLEELAREMRRALKPRQKARWLSELEERFELLKAADRGAVDFARLARTLTEKELEKAGKGRRLTPKQFQDSITEKAPLKARSLRRIASRIGVHTRAAGRPKKSDT